MEVQFVSNAAGKPTAVLVPIKEWERIQQYLPAKVSVAEAVTPAKLSKKEQFKEDFREGVREMKLMQAGKIPKYSLRKLLAELDNEL